MFSIMVFSTYASLPKTHERLQMEEGGGGEENAQQRRGETRRGGRQGNKAVQEGGEEYLTFCLPLLFFWVFLYRNPTPSPHRHLTLASTYKPTTSCPGFLSFEQINERGGWRNEGGRIRAEGGRWRMEHGGQREERIIFVKPPPHEIF